jgi:uncharacterized protein (TIGR04255 family)
MTQPDRRLLPRFENAPVIETVLGLEFAPLDKWTLVHFGIFWQQVCDQFPEFKVQPPLGSEIEDLNDASESQRQMRLQFVDQPDVRCWFLSADGRTLIQVQRNRFTFNWKKEDGAYPHYDESIRPAFVKAWTTFSRFVEENHLGQVSVLQCEITYVNHIEKGKGWDSFADLPAVFPCWAGHSSARTLPIPEDVSIFARYRLPDRKGRLRVAVQPAVRPADGATVIQLTLTARGAPASGDFESALEWLDLGREWVVRGFADFTSKKMHKIWRRSS